MYEWSYVTLRALYELTLTERKNNPLLSRGFFSFCSLAKFYVQDPARARARDQISTPGTEGDFGGVAGCRCCGDLPT